MAVKRVIDVLKLEPITNPTPANGDVWRDIADGELKYHNDNATYNFLTNAATSGGTYYKLSEDFTNTDATSTPENVTGMAFAVEADSVYYVEGALLWYDDAAYGSGKVTLNVPSGTTWDFIEQSLTSSGTIGNDAWMDNYDNGGVGNMNQTNSGNTYNTFKGIVVTSSTAGTVQLQFINTAGDGTEQGLRKGSFIRVQA